MRFKGYSCTKIRTYLEEKRAKWMIDNLSAEEAKELYNKVRECSPQAAAGIYKVMRFIVDSVENRK